MSFVFDACFGNPGKVPIFQVVKMVSFGKFRPLVKTSRATCEKEGVKASIRTHIENIVYREHSI